MEREQEIDLMKGFAILLVIFGHFFGLKVISIFHMPLWYVLSGYFFRHENFLLSAKNNARRLLIPYFCVCAIITLSFFVIDTNKAFCFLNQALLGEPIKNNLGVMLGPVWFLLSLFWCKWIYNVASIKFSNNSILGLSFLLTAIVAVLTPYTDYSIYPFFISTVPIGVFFYSIGVKWRESNKCIFPEFRYPFVVSVVIAVFLTYFQIKEPRFNMSLTILSFFPLCLVNAYLYTYILYCICLKISNIRILGGVKWCGRNSIDILLFHCWEYCILMPIMRDAINKLNIKGAMYYVTWFSCFILCVLMAIAYTWLHGMVFK